MGDLSTKYMGLTLNSPIIIGSCGLTNSLENIKKFESRGAGAVVLKSIFEEQILRELNSMRISGDHAEAEEYLNYYTRKYNLDEYLNLIASVKKEVSIPIIASINCHTAGEWINFARTIQDSGADGLELNMFIFPGNINQTGEEIENIYFSIVSDIKKHIEIPVSLKVGNYFSSMANMIHKLSQTGISAVVLFNRFVNPDINIDDIKVVASEIFSPPEANELTLRWIGVLSDIIGCDLASSTGIFDGQIALKNLLAGAKVVQVVSAIYKFGFDHIKLMMDQIRQWMKVHDFQCLEDFTGLLSQKNIKDSQLYERVQFMKYFSDAR